MSCKSNKQERHSKYIGSVRIAATLLDGPRTFEENFDRSLAYLRLLGLFKRTERRKNSRSLSEMRKLDDLIQRGWVASQEKKYSLTSLGQEEVGKRLSQLEIAGSSLDGLLHPKTASKLTTVVHWVLVMIKLPAALVSGSVGLLNNSIFFCQNYMLLLLSGSLRDVVLYMLYSFFSPARSLCSLETLGR